MGLFGFGGKKKDDEPEEVDEILEMIFEDPEFDDFAENGMVTPTNPIGVKLSPEKVEADKKKLL